MGSSTRWVAVVIVVAAVYCGSGIVFGALAGQASSHQLVVAWRLAAWVISAVAFVAHVAYEHFQFSNPPHRSALHAAFAVAIGAFGLAVAAMIHGQRANTGNHFPPLALAVWPIITALPAFVGGLILAGVISRVSRAS